MTGNPRKTRQRTIILAVIVALATDGCAGFLKLTPEATAKLDAFNQWADTWIQGARQQLPLILAAASMVPEAQPYVGKAGTVLADADAAIDAYKASVEALKAGDATPEEIAAKQAQVLAVIERIKHLVGAIKDQIDA